MIVVASTGNEGSSPYITTSPGTSYRRDQRRRQRSDAGLPGREPRAVDGRDAPGDRRQRRDLLGRDDAAGQGAHLEPGRDRDRLQPGLVRRRAGALVVTRRLVGGCARVARAIYGQQAGAAAVVMVNNTNGFPPFDGQISSNPDTGEPYNVTIPFLGVPASAGAALIAADGKSATLATRRSRIPAT